MDARIEVDAMEAKAFMVAVEVTTVIVVDDLAIELVSLFDAASVLAPLRNMGNSVTAVAPDYIIEGGVSVQAMV
jgi:hypothetical protein